MSKDRIIVISIGSGSNLVREKPTPEDDPFEIDRDKAQLEQKKAAALVVKRTGYFGSDEIPHVEVDGNTGDVKHFIARDDGTRTSVTVKSDGRLAAEVVTGNGSTTYATQNADGSRDTRRVEHPNGVVVQSKFSGGPGNFTEDKVIYEPNKPPRRETLVNGRRQPG